MPLIQVDLDRDLYQTQGDELGAAIHQAQIDALGTPPDDLFQVFRPHEPGELKFDPAYGGVDRQSLILISITAVHHHPVTAKQALYRALVDRLAALGVRPEDLLVCLVENGFEDWYAGSIDTQESR